jgi:hypothetical protein
MKHITIHKEEQDNLKEGLFLINPVWIHLDEREIKDKSAKGEKLFKVKVEEIS